MSCASAASWINSAKFTDTMTQTEAMSSDKFTQTGANPDPETDIPIPIPPHYVKCQVAVLPYCRGDIALGTTPGI